MNGHHDFGQTTGFFCGYEFLFQQLWAQVVGAWVNVDKINLRSGAIVNNDLD